MDAEPIDEWSNKLMKLINELYKMSPNSEIVVGIRNPLANKESGDELIMYLNTSNHNSFKSLLGYMEKFYVSNYSFSERPEFPEESNSIDFWINRTD